MTRSALVLRGDARHLPLPDASVDLVCTSPPYWSLRSYTDNGQHYAGQIGAEHTPQEYIANLIDCTREWVRVLKPSGSIWVNLGDSYYSGKGAPGRTTVDGKSEARTVRRAGGNPLDGPSFGIGRKSLILLPERYRIAAVDELGLIARAIVVWSKPNSLPESVTDRVRRSHEDFVHLTKAPRYFSAVDEIRTPQKAGPERTRVDLGGAGQHQRMQGGRSEQTRQAWSGNPLGKLPGSVWTIATEPLTVPEHLGVDHFAAFPIEWPRRIILGWSPSGICVECGEGRRPVLRPSRLTADGERLAAERGDASVAYSAAVQTGAPGESFGRRRALSGTELRRFTQPAAITGETCACPDPTAPTRPAVVLDPFSGTGTTVLVASALGRHGIGVDRSADYCRLAQWRTTDRAQLAKAMRVSPPPKVHDGQLDLFGEVA